MFEAMIFISGSVVITYLLIIFFAMDKKIRVLELENAKLKGEIQ